MCPAAGPLAQNAVTVVRDGRHVHVLPPVEAVRRVLVSAGIVVRDGVSGLALGWRQTPMAAVHADGLSFATLAGLEPAVVLACERAGYAVRLMGERPGPLPMPVLDPDAEPAVLEFVRAHDAGIIRHAPGRVNPARLVASVTRAWPALTVAVVAHTVDESRRVRDELNAAGVPCATVNNRDRTFLGDDRVVVARPRGLGADEVHLHQRDVVFVLDGLAAWGRRSIECLIHATRARMYGLVRIGVPISAHENDQLVALFGCASVTVPAYGRVERHVTVEMELVDGGDRPSHMIAGIDLKRAGIWRHGLRNRLVAKTAAGLRAADRSAIVLVESIDHALALTEALPGWTIVADGPVNLAGLTSSCRKKLAETQHDPLAAFARPLIVTASALSHLPLDTIDVIVRADGGYGLPPFTPRQLEARPGIPPLAVIDFHDRHHPALRRDSRARRQAYAKRGWFAPGIDPVVGRTALYLDTRPRSGGLLDE